MATWDERDFSRPYATQGRDIEVVTRRFIVYDVLPWEATRLAEPPLPTFGDLLPTRASVGRSVSMAREDATIQVREIQANYAPGSTNNSEVIITYRSGPDWRENPAGQRLVEWSVDSGGESDTVFVDNAGVYIPEGIQVYVPVITIRAVMDGGLVPAGVPALAGQYNKTTFRWFFPRWVRFASVSATGITSSDVYFGRNRVEYEFIAKPGGWAQKRPKKTEKGEIILGTDGLPIMTEHAVGPDFDFKILFPPNFNPGFFAFFDPYPPIIP